MGSIGLGWQAKRRAEPRNCSKTSPIVPGPRTIRRVGRPVCKRRRARRCNLLSAAQSLRLNKLAASCSSTGGRSNDSLPQPRKCVAKFVRANDAKHCSTCLDCLVAGTATGLRRGAHICGNLNKAGTSKGRNISQGMRDSAPRCYLATGARTSRAKKQQYVANQCGPYQAAGGGVSTAQVEP